MPDEKTRADSLRFYLTGAGSDGGSQTDPNASLGGYRSSTACQYMAASITSPISNITVDFVAGANGVGNGTLNAASASTLTWTAPGGTAGPAVTIANGETKILESSGDPTKYIRITRTSTDDLTGTATLGLSYVANDVTGFDNVSSTEAAAGDTEYRCLMVRNEHATIPVTNLAFFVGTLGTQQVSDTGDLDASGAGTISTSGSFADWPETGFCHINTGSTTREIVYYSSRTDTALTIPAGGRGKCGTTAAAGDQSDTLDAVPGIEVAVEVPVSSAVQTIANEGTAPTGLTWKNGTTSAGAATHSSLAVGALLALWIRRTIIAGHQSIYNTVNLPRVTFDSV